jgi:hypothetical protein
MSGHWSEFEAAMMRYQGIESRLEVQRPIAFLIATTRKFNLEAFCDSLLESLRGSRFIKPGQECLLHLYLASKKSVATTMPHKFQDLLTYTALSFDEKGTNNIGATRKRQIELAELACNQLENPILVVLDDDLTFETLTVMDGLPVKTYPFSYVHEVYLFAQNHPCDVALGGVTGAPPLPATSCMRTFLQDFLGTQSTSKNNEGRWSDTDYYYDLSETRTCWQTWPTLSLNSDPHPVQRALNQMFHSGLSNRPLVYTANETTPQPRIVRGGNTAVFNPEFLLKIDHPDLPRRGDSLWAILASEYGATILDFPYPLHHTRNADVNMTLMQERPFRESLKKRMSDDLLGASMQRAMFDDCSLLPIYLGRLEHQLQLVKDCLLLLLKAKRFIDNGSENHGFWALSLNERISFCNEARKILDSLKLHLEEQINQVEVTSEKSTLMIKAMRYDARNAMEEGQ